MNQANIMNCPWTHGVKLQTPNEYKEGKAKSLSL